jgi:ligand-binding sensor domain-containing protein/serine phosphatase RsbU (regulator of sigma subunit)
VRKSLIILFLCVVLAGFVHSPLKALVSSVQAFTINEGLSNNSINVIFQDSRGFLWIGTDDGLNRFDGYNFLVFKKTPAEGNGLSGNRILAIAEDKFGNIWVGTRTGGISVLMLETGDMVHYRHNPQDKHSLPEDIICGFHINSDGDIWIKTENYLSRHDPETGLFFSYGHFSNVFKRSQPGSMPVMPESDSTFLMGTKDGLNRFNRLNGVYVRLHVTGNQGAYLNDLVTDILTVGRGRYLAASRVGLRYFEPGVYMLPVQARNNLGGEIAVNSLMEDRTGNIWVGTTRGLEIFRTENFTHEVYQGNAAELRSVIPYEVTEIFEDASGLLWVGTRFNGLYKLSTHPPKFTFIGEEDEWQWPLKSFNIKAVHVDPDGRIWMGTMSAGVYALYPESKALRHFVVSPEAFRSQNDAVHSLHKDSDGVLWIGTNHGVYFLEPGSITIREFYYGYDPKYATLLRNNVISSIVKDSAGVLWIGTQFGLYRYISGRISGFFSDEGDLWSDEVNALCVDKDGRLWIGTSGGVNYFNESSGLVEKVKVMADERQFNNQVLSLACDDNNRLWVGSRSGLMTIVREPGDSLSFSFVDALQNEMVTSILTDLNRRIWVSSSKGISQLASEGVVRHFDSYDGLPGQLFNPGSAFRSTGGELFFGGVNGLCWIHPENIGYNLHRPRIAITDISLCHRGECSQLLKGNLRELRIKYHPGQLLEIKFAAMEFTQPKRNQFRVMLEGYDKEWRPVSNLNSITFSNLTPGRYKLSIKASNNDSTWNNQAYELPIIISPPLWMTNYAYAFYLLIVIFLFQGIINYRIRNYKRANRLLAEKNVDKKRIEKQREALSKINQNLTDSINYATRIQSAMIPSEKVLRDIFPNAFVYFRPRDLVSGDFYWLFERDNKVFVAVVDCTGHGVPGAFMSIIGMDILKNIIGGQKENSPGRVLEKLSKELDYTLTKNAASFVGHETIKDGMDMSLCVFDRTKRELAFAGAVNGLYLIRNNELMAWKGDRYAIGRTQDGQVPQYTTTTIPILENDALYLFSDGYVDQFGGPDKKKFKFRRFRHLLLNIHRLHPDDQRSIIHQKFEEWRGKEEQVDDILLLGFKPLSKEKS